LLKDLGKVVHHHVPLSLEDFFEQYFDRISRPSSLFSSAMGGCQDFRGWSCKGSTSSSPNSLYPNLVGDMQRKIEKKATCSDTTDPTLKMNTTNYRDNHKHRYVEEIILHFINVKY